MNSRNDAGDTIVVLGMCGFVVAVISSIIAAAQWPSDVTDDGSTVVASLACAACALGVLATIVAATAWGVWLTLRATGVLEALTARPSSGAGTGVVAAPPVQRRRAEGLAGLDALDDDRA